MLRSVTRRQGGRAVTIQKIEPPFRPPTPAAPAIPAPETDAESPEFRAWLAEMRAKAPEHRMAILSATVFDHERTFLRCWIAGGDGPPQQSFACWSNIDFNDFCGVGSVEVGGVRYGLILGVGNADTARLRKLRTARGLPPLEASLPPCPPLPADRPAFLPVPVPPRTLSSATDAKTSPADNRRAAARPSEAQAFLAGLHEIHARAHGRLAAARESREAARKEREAYLKAHPPKPRDAVIRFWRNK